MKVLLALCTIAMLLGVSTFAAIGDDAVVVEGVVQSISGETLTVKSDDGQTTVVDVSEADRRRVALGALVSVVGAFVPELNKFKARSIAVARVGS